MICASRREVKDIVVDGETTSVDFGEVGDAQRRCIARHDQQVIPVISPIASGPDGAPLNVNADTIASELAIALKASKLIMMTQAPEFLRMRMTRLSVALGRRCRVEGT